MRTGLSHGGGQEAEGDRGEPGTTQPSRMCPQEPASSSQDPPSKVSTASLWSFPAGVQDLSSDSGISYVGPSRRLFRCLGLLLYCKNLARVHPLEMTQNTEMEE